MYLCVGFANNMAKYETIKVLNIKNNTIMMNIVILDGYASNPGDLNWDLLKQLGNVTVYPRTTDEEKVERSKDADIILINKVQMDADTLAQLPR